MGQPGRVTEPQARRRSMIRIGSMDESYLQLTCLHRGAVDTARLARTLGKENDHGGDTSPA